MALNKENKFEKQSQTSSSGFSRKISEVNSSQDSEELNRKDANQNEEKIELSDGTLLRNQISNLIGWEIKNKSKKKIEEIQKEPQPVKETESLIIKSEKYYQKFLFIS